MRTVLLALSALVLQACSAPPRPPPRRVPVVAIADPPEHEPPSTSSETFACRPARVGDSAEIELSIRALEQGSSTSEELSSRASYRVRILALDEGEIARAEVTLERIEPENVEEGRQQMAWHTALAQGWIERERPFELLREAREARWCFAEAGQCRDQDATTSEFADAVGETLSLVERPELATQLEGKKNDGTLTLILSPALRKRASLGVMGGETARASEQGHGFPAVFRFPLHDPSAETDATSGQSLWSKLKIDRACRLRSLTTVLSTDTKEYESLHELNWSITPGW